MQKIYVVGHGKWVPLNGWVKVPSGVSITFYSNIYTSLQNTAVFDLLEGKKLGDIPQRKFFEGQWIENQTLSYNSAIGMCDYEGHAARHPDERTLNRQAKFLYVHQKDARTTLREIFENYKGQILSDGSWDLHWACCRALVAADQIAYDQRLGPKTTVPMMRVRAQGVTEAVDDAKLKPTGVHNPNGTLVTTLGRPITVRV